MGVRISKGRQPCHFCKKQDYNVRANIIRPDYPDGSRQAVFCDNCLRDLINKYTVFLLEGSDEQE